MALSVTSSALAAAAQAMRRTTVSANLTPPCMACSLDVPFVPIPRATRAQARAHLQRANLPLVVLTGAGIAPRPPPGSATWPLGASGARAGILAPGQRPIGLLAYSAARNGLEGARTEAASWRV